MFPLSEHPPYSCIFELYKKLLEGKPNPTTSQEALADLRGFLVHGKPFLAPRVDRLLAVFRCAEEVLDCNILRKEAIYMIDFECRAFYVDGNRQFSVEDCLEEYLQIFNILNITSSGKYWSTKRFDITDVWLERGKRCVSVRS